MNKVKSILLLLSVFLPGTSIVFAQGTEEVILEMEVSAAPGSPDDSTLAAAAAVVETIYVTEDGDTIPPESLAALEALTIDRVPELKEFIKARYPPDELRRGIEGKVVMEFIVTDSGRVDSLRIIQSLTPSLDSAAVRAVEQFAFTPALVGTVAVPVIIQYEYRFSIAEEAEKIDEYVNFTGTLLEKGTRYPIADGMVVITFTDPVTDTSVTVPWEVYLEKIGSFKGQHAEAGRLVTFSDSLGRFSFKSLPAGSLTVTFPLTGYQATQADELIEYGQRLSVDYWLQRESYDEYEFIVYGKIEKKEVAKKSINLYEVKKIPGFGGDAVKVVQTLPGVARAPFNAGLIIVRGSGMEDTRYFLDGIAIAQIFHFGGLKSTYNSDALSSIDLYPGGFNTRYGGCVGGVVEIKGRPAAGDRWHGSTDINLLDASFLAEGPLTENLSLMVTGRRSYIANMLNFIIEHITPINTPMTVVPYYWDLVGRLDYKISPSNRMFLTAFGSQDRLEFIVQDVRGGSNEVSGAKDAISQDVNFQRLIYGYDKKFNDRLGNELRLSLNRDITDFGVFQFVTMDLVAWGFTLRDQLQYKPLKTLQVNLGLDMEAAYIDYLLKMISQRGVTKSDVGKWFSIAGAYLNAEYRPGEKLLIMPGLRYDWYNEIGQGAPSFRLTSHYQATDRDKLKGAVGTYNQSPKPLGQTTDPEWGNNDLPPTLATHAVIGYEREMTDLVNIDVQAYYNLQDDIPNMTDETDPVTGEYLNWRPDLKGRMYGLEIMLRHDQGKRFFGWVSYTLARSERQSPRKPSNYIEGVWDPAQWFLFDYDQTHNLQVLGTWKLPWNFEAGFRLRYVTGNPDTPYLGFTSSTFEYDADYGYYTPLLGQWYSDRMGPFFQLDLRVDKKLVSKKWMLSTYLDVQNVNYFWYNSPEFYSYNFDYSQRQTIGGIILPTIGLQAKF